MRIIPILIFMVMPLVAQSLKGTNNEGVDKYEGGNFDDAIGLFKKGTEIDNKSAVPDFNLGAGYYKKGNYKESIQSFQNALGKSTDPGFQSKAWYNMGNAHLKAGDYQAAVDAYKNSLKLDPNDQDAKYNLSYSLKKLKQKQEEEKKKQDDKKKDDKKDDKKKDQPKQDDKKNDQNKDNKKDQNKNDDKKDNKDNKKDQNKNDDKKDNKDKKDQQQPNNPKPDKNLSKEDAEKILNALKDKERDVRKNKKNQQLRGFGREKDW